MPDLILASASPRRRELLSLTGLTFSIDAAEVDEHTSLGAKEAVLELCRRKALAVAARHPGEIVLAADTLVAMHDIPFGKPEDEEDACRMLRSLSGKWHQVYTGVCTVSKDGQIHTGLDTSDVHFMDMSEDDILSYVRTGEPMDKAGAYALQGIAGIFISEVRGTPSGVIGLPLPLTHELLERCGLHIPCVKPIES
ncbi:MAG: Maf family protein [Clostridiales bacterium]|nr:septum formation protein Maf [Clostridia bacterium]MCR4883294.1 Maf family protein [Clostridiales bacterium]